MKWYCEFFSPSTLSYQFLNYHAHFQSSKTASVPAVGGSYRTTAIVLFVSGQFLESIRKER